MPTRKTIGWVAVLGLVALGVPGSASANSKLEKRADRIMREVTAQMVHAPSATGVDHDELTPADWFPMYDAGERLYLRCGYQVVVAREMLRRAGIRSRELNAISTYDDGSGNTGHIFMDVWVGDRWVVYDPDGNRQPLDRKGNPVNVEQAVKSRPFHWRYTATDPYYEPDPSYGYDDLDEAADHALGIPFIRLQSGYLAYHTKSKKLRQRAESVHGGTALFVSRKRWRKLIGPTSEEAK